MVKRVDMMTQLINTGAKQKVSSKQGDNSSDQSDFEKMLGQASQQGTAAESTDSTTTPKAEAVTVTETDSEEPGVEQLSLAAALITVQPVIPVDTITPVEVEDIAPAGEAAAAAVMPEGAEGVYVQQAAAAPVVTTEAVQQQAEVEEMPEDAVPAEAVSEQPVEAVAEEAAPSTGTETEPQQQADVSAEAHEAAPVKVSEDSDQPVVEDASAAVETPVFEQAETVPVKVADTGEPVEPESEEAAQKIAQHIEQAMEQGESTVELSLSPANLGQLTVTITRSGDGSLSLVLTTVTEKAAHLIDRHAVNLQNMLADSQNVHVEVETRTHEPQAQQFLNPDGSADHHQQHQQQKKKDDSRNDGDFLQQLRLGLVGLD